MKRLIRRLGNVLSTISVVMIININTVSAATRLTPYHLYLWAKNANVTRLEEYKRYINIKDYTTQNTALCIAQQQKDYSAYKLLLQFGASIHVPCHDNSDLQCRKIIKEVGGIDTGLLVLGAAAIGGGALALGGGGGGGSSGPGCNVNDYTLEECPEHGICSTCEEKYKLDSCQEFWKKSEEQICVPAACPAGQYLKGGCPTHTGTSLKEVPSTSFSGNEQCYICQYTCDTSSGFYQDKTSCMNTYPGYSCKQHENGCYIMDVALPCPNGEALNCEEREGFKLTQTESGNLSGTNKCYRCTYAPTPCPENQYTNGNCPSVIGNKVDYVESGEMSGNDKCYTCSYSCNTSLGYYPSSGNCETANPGKFCSLNEASGCYKAGGCDNSKDYYDNEAEFSAKYPGYNPLFKNGCYTKGSAKECPNNQFTSGNCPAIEGQTSSQIATPNYSGDARCYRCSYQCNIELGYYDGLSQCTTAHIGNTCKPVSPSGCYKVSGCDTSKKYYDKNTDCIIANTNKTCAFDSNSNCYKVTGCDNAQGYYDTQEEISAQFPGYNIIESNGCYMRGTAKTCPEGETTTCTPRKGNTVVKKESGNYAGTVSCGICEYTCNNQLKYYKDNQNCTTSNYGKICSYDEEAQCYKPTGCNTILGYYDSVSACEQKETGYYCTSAGDGCYTKGTAKDCPEGEYLKGKCPQRPGATAIENPSGNMSGSEKCYTCSYKCNATEKYYDDAGSCEAANIGMTCTQDDVTKCYIPSSCNTAGGYYDEEDACLAANTGHLCTIDPISSCYVQGACNETEHYYTEQTTCEDYYTGYSCTQAYGCYIKGSDKPCPSEPVQEYTECPEKTGNTVIPTPTDNFSGAKQCYTCAYQCNEAEDYYTDDNSCQRANPEEFCNLNQESGCYIPSGCNNAGGFYEEQADCEDANIGYTCKLQEKCYVKDVAKDCPADEFLEGKCPEKTGNNVSQTPTGNMSGENQCFSCVYTCDTSEKYYNNNTLCEQANIGKMCSIDEASSCYRVSGCNTNNGYYDDNGSCTAANIGLLCKLDAISSCYVKDKCDIAQKHYDDRESCLAANTGLECEIDAETSCYIPTKCSSASGYYDEQDTCETANTGYNCAIQSNGCYQKGEAKECPEEQYTECAPKAEHTVKPSATSDFSGEKQCYICTYSCDTENNYYDNTDTCEQANRGYNCSKTENNCYIKSDAKTCPLDEYTECPEKNGNIPTPSATGNYAGDLPCYSCTYGCDTSNNYYDDQSACLKVHPGNLCELDRTSGCNVPGNCNTDKGWYSSNELCSVAFPGWNCANTAGCYTKSTPKSCPTDEYTSGMCPGKTGNTVSEIATDNFAGDAPCYSCEYTCDTKNNYYKDNLDCTGAHPTKVCSLDDTSGCYIPTGCDANKGNYDAKDDCETNNEGYTCTLQEDCYVKGEPKDCPADQYTSGNCPKKDGNLIQEVESGAMSGEEQCYTCQYTCDTKGGFFTTESNCKQAYPEFTCVSDMASGCYIPASCSVEDGYYEDIETCKANYKGYNCQGSHDCYTKGEALQCPADQYTVCPAIEGNVAIPSPTGNFSGDAECNTCAYECDTGNRYYETEDACSLAQPEYICVSDTASGCYKPSKCDQAQNFYDDQIACENYYDGYTCKTQNGCYVKGVEKQCPSGEYITCPTKEGNKVTATPTDNKSGEEVCNTCAYTCDTEQKYYTEKEECNIANPSHSCEFSSSANCYTITGCDNSRGFYASYASCTSTFKGYECVLQAGCYTKGEIKNCPTGEYTSGKCQERVGNDVEEIESGNYTGEEKCYSCKYTCKSSEGYYSEQGICETENTGRSCAIDNSSQCYMVSGCRTDMGWYTNTTDCEKAFPGYSCSYHEECYIKGSPKECPNGQVKTGNCPEKAGTTVSESPSGSLSGEELCYNCIYTCKTDEGYYDSNGECTAANPGKACYHNIEVGCFEVSGCDTLNSYYDTPNDCEQANAGYYCQLDADSQCYIKGQARTCPQNEYTTGGCPPRPHNSINEIPSGNYAGDDACYRCSYNCLGEEGYYGTASICEDENVGYICENDAESGCFIKTDAADCPTDEYTSGNCPNKTGNSIQYIESGNYSGSNKCYTCSYECDVTNKYYSSDELCTSNNVGRTCSYDDLSSCFIPTGCDEIQGYYESLEKCMQNNIGYDCKSQDGCYVKDIALNCPENQYVTCPEREGNNVESTPSGNYTGPYECNICEYSCDNARYFYTEEEQCTTANPGKLCEKNIAAQCYQPTTCDEANNFYNKQNTCEEHYSGYKCVISGGCYIQGGAKPCPENEYTTCPTITGKELVNQTKTENMSGTEQCYTCEYQCDTASNYYELPETCSAAHTNKVCSLDETSGCYFPKTCNAEENFYDSQEQCEEIYPGYTCKADNDCYVQGEALPCPEGEQLTCANKIGNITNKIESGHLSGTETCYICTYSCDTTQNYYQDIESCLENNPEYLCSLNESANCYKPSTCDESKGFYNDAKSCSNVNPGYECNAVQNGCTAKGDAKSCYDDQEIEGNCTKTTGIITTEKSMDNYSGDKKCVTCYYECDTAAGYQSEITCKSFAPAGDNCEAVSFDNINQVCYIRTLCNAEENLYNTADICETDNPGYNCIFNNSKKCYIKDTAKDCPEGEYITCPTQTGKIATPTPTANKAGEEVCNTCSYTCDTGNGYYNSQEECPEGSLCTPDETSGCYKASATDISNYTIKNTTDISKMIAGEEDGYGLKSSADIENSVDEESGIGGKISLSHYGSGTAYGQAVL